jgi:hypothetical protein
MNADVIKRIAVAVHAAEQVKDSGELEALRADADAFVAALTRVATHEDGSPFTREQLVAIGQEASSLFDQTIARSAQSPATT